MTDLVASRKDDNSVGFEASSQDGLKMQSDSMQLEYRYDDDEDILDEESDDQIQESEDASAFDEEKVGEDSEDKPEGLLGYKYKRVLKHDSLRTSMEPLPEGWVKATHCSGIPIYLHKKSRVVTWSRPYSLLSGYVVKHKVPLQSIPCLHYLKNRQKSGEWDNNIQSQKLPQHEEKTEVTLPESASQESDSCAGKSNSIDSSIPQPKVILHQQKDLCLSDEELKEYLEKRFVFETLEIPQFKKWSQRRDFNRNMRRKKLEEANPAAASENFEDKESKAGNAKLITLTVEQEDGPGGGIRNRKFVLNTSGKPMICILHEYAQRVLRIQPNYIFKIREDSAEPFEASIKLNDKIYGTAVAINKKTAKNKAALATLEILIPGFKGQVESTQESRDMSYFSEVSVTDPRVQELCVHTGQLLPYQLLTECLKRNQGIADTTVSYDVQQGKRRSLNYTMKCGKHIVTGVAKNKKIGKQLAAQQILQLLHPKIKTWAELIELYGTSLAQERAHRKQEEQEIFDLKRRKGNEDEPEDVPSTSKQATDEEKRSMEPNPELLSKLREMMFKLQAAQDKERRARAEEPSSAKRRKLTPMAAAVAAGKGLLDDSKDSDDGAGTNSEGSDGILNEN